MQFRVTSFNLGIHQTMIQPGQAKQQTIEAHLMNFQRVCGKIVGAGRVDLFFGCEVDGAREGFSNNMSGLFGEKLRVFGEKFRSEWPPGRCYSALPKCLARRGGRALFALTGAATT